MTGKKLKEMLNKLGMTTRSLAEKMNVTPQTISAFLSANDIRTSTVERISAVTGTPISYWYDETRVIERDNYDEEQVDSLNRSNGITYVENLKIHRVNLGEIIRNLVEAKGMSQAQFARLIGLQRQNVRKTVFDKTNIDTDLLCVISEVLDCNLFEYFHSNSIYDAKELKATLTIEMGRKKQDKVLHFVFGDNNSDI